MVAKNYSKNRGWIQKMMAHSLTISNIIHHDGSRFMEEYEKKVKKEPHIFCPKKIMYSSPEVLVGKRHGPNRI